jgi:1,4-dihydroxy-2-naphthoyl-CoA synthase
MSFQYKNENVKVEIRDGIAYAIMNRPEKRNAMSPDLHFGSGCRGRDHHGCRR